MDAIREATEKLAECAAMSMDHAAEIISAAVKEFKPLTADDVRAIGNVLTA